MRRKCHRHQHRYSNCQKCSPHLRLSCHTSANDATLKKPTATKISDQMSSVPKASFLTDIYEVRPRKDHHGVDLISDALPFGRLWYGEPNAVSNAIGYAKHRSRSQDAVIRVYDAAGTVIITCSWHQRPFALTPRNADRHGAGRAADQL